ncbi:MAG: phosphate ABC transporter substrate-binding protein [Planctomycetes bacterium]|nr:phosphate ABC transporter substrate-binding protein [Planctomycetota bacterium]
MTKKALLLTTSIGAALCALFATTRLDANDGTGDLRPYEKSGDALKGTLNSIGSDTMNNLMTLWAEGFARYHAGVKVQVEGKGSSTAPPALEQGTAQLGPMSRPMKAEEVDSFEAKFGYKPLEIATCLDALAVFVHKDCPLEQISLEEVDAVFSNTNKRGLPPIDTWGHLGLTGDYKDARISMFGRNSASGTYGYFKEHALKKGDFRNLVKEQPGSSAVVQGVAEDRFAIGYSGIGYKTENVKALKLCEKKGGKTFEANLENCVSGDYPLARNLLVYVNRAPGRPLDPVIKEFLTFVLSKEGQEIVAKDGYLPLPAELAAEELKKLQ